MISWHKSAIIVPKVSKYPVAPKTALIESSAAVPGVEFCLSEGEEFAVVGSTTRGSFEFDFHVYSVTHERAILTNKDTLQALLLSSNLLVEVSGAPIMQVTYIHPEYFHNIVCFKFLEPTPKRSLK